MINHFSETSDDESSFINQSYDINELKQNLTTEILNSQYRGLLKTTEWLYDVLNSKNLVLCENQINNFNTCFLSHNTKYFYCKIFYDQNEFLRCAHHLKDSLTEHPILDFLYFISRFKACLKRLTENEMNSMVSESPKNFDDLISLNEEISEFINDNPNHDSYILYIRGIILKKLNLLNEAKSVFLEALDKNEYLWCAWYELSDIALSHQLVLPTNWMREFFEVKCLKVKSNYEECNKKINTLVKIGFENVQDLKIDLATVNESTNRSIYSIEIFDEIYDNDPYRMDYFSTYSNILFVQENHRKLAELTDNCLKIDRYRYETCCVAGNFYSLRGKHEKAVCYFQRALKLNPVDSNIWILTAHEYLELDNLKAAVKCYSNAIYHNPSNYRAYYGLGQFYEMLKIHDFAIISYAKALELKPNDSRIIIALGTVYEELGRHDWAKKCYYRAYNVGDVEHVALIKIGKLYEKLKDMNQAAIAFDMYVTEAQVKGLTDFENLTYANFFLGNYHWKITENLLKARCYAMKCSELSPSERLGEDLLKSIDQTLKGDAASDFQQSFDHKEIVIPSHEILALDAMKLTIWDTTLDLDSQDIE